MDEANTRNIGIETEANVLQVHRSKGAPVLADIRFKTTDGRTIETELDVEAARNFDEADGTVQVRYELSDPEYTAVVAEVDRVAYWVQFAVLAFIVIVLPGALIRALAGYGKTRD